MKFLNILLIAFLFISMPACSEDTSSNSTIENKQNAGSTQLKILEPQGNIDAIVQSELEEGRWELVVFWATYCPVCKRDFDNLAKFIKENPEVPLSIVGVVVDGDEEREKAIMQINKRELNYTHVISDFQHSNKLYKAVTDSELIGVPAQLLFNKSNELVGFGSNAIDIDALEIMVYDE